MDFRISDKSEKGDSLRQPVWARHIWGEKPDTFHRGASLDARKQERRIKYERRAASAGSAAAISFKTWRIRSSSGKHTFRKENRRKENVYFIVCSLIWQLHWAKIIFNRPWHIHFWTAGWAKGLPQKGQCWWWWSIHSCDSTFLLLCCALNQVQVWIERMRMEKYSLKIQAVASLLPRCNMIPLFSPSLHFSSTTVKQ